MLGKKKGPRPAIGKSIGCPLSKPTKFYPRLGPMTSPKTVHHGPKTVEGEPHDPPVKHEKEKKERHAKQKTLTRFPTPGGETS